MSRSLPRSVTLPRGFRAAGTTCGIKPSGKPDMSLIVADVPCAAAAVFTTNRVPSAPVTVGRRHIRSGKARAFVINSGCANAATGKQGEANAIAMCKHVAEVMQAQGTPISPREVLPSSTGVIGPQLPMDKIARGIGQLAAGLSRGPEADRQAAQGIMTTDLVPKAGNVSFKLNGRTVRIGGIAKGSGMIAPNLATMLVYLATDAAISPAMLRQALRTATGASFNRISVDQHTSPSDTVAILASGLAGHKTITATGRAFRLFVEKLTDLCKNLAYQIVQDGEGATRVFHVTVTGARSEREADRVARAVVDSPLVKTAVHGCDPNWGRIVTAAGYAGVPITPAKLTLTIGKLGRPGVTVFSKGVPCDLTKAQQRRLDSAMTAHDVAFTLTLGRGKAEVTWLGCDLSREYIRINADYTT